MRARPVRVLLLAKGLGRGGMERLISASAPHFDRERVHVEVAYLLARQDAFVEEIRGRGLAVHCLEGGVLPDLSWVWRLRRLVRTGGFGVVHTHSPLPASVARIALARAKPVLMHTEHSVWPRYRVPTYLANAATYGRNAAVVAISQGVADSIRQPRWMYWVSMPRVEVLHHGIDEQLVRSGPEARARARRTLGLADDDVVLGAVGSFTPAKDHRTILEAVRQVTDHHPRLRLVLVGSGPLEARLRAHAVTAGIGERVMFTGSRDDVQEILPAFDAFVISSRYEGLSLALIEALAAGVPAVATTAGGIPEVVTDGREGLLVPPAQPALMANAIDRLLRDPEQRAEMAAQARQRAKCFRIAHAVRRLEDIYDEVLNGR